MKQFINNLLRSLGYQFIKYTRETTSEHDKLKLVPRYTPASTFINNCELQITDSASFLFMYDEIFKSEIYKFTTDKRSPYIIDAGANIGLASIYFKSLYPDAEIVAFEPDPNIYQVLKSNIKNFGFEGIELIEKGLWNDDLSLRFLSEGADAGILNTLSKSNTTNLKNVPVVSLKPYLLKTVDFLKLDIEGAETVVLKDIAEDLNKVERIFVEYHSFLAQPQTLNEIINILKHANFRLYISSPGVVNKSPFINVSAYMGMDMQLNIYGIKEQ